MAYVSKDNFAGSTLAILYERLFKQVRVALKFDNKELADAEIRAKAEEYTSTFITKIPDIQAMILKDVDAEFNALLYIKISIYSIAHTRIPQIPPTK